MICQKCGNETFDFKEQVFKNNITHIKQSCAKCKAFIQYAPQEKNIEEIKMHFGKFKGKSFREIEAIDPDYLRWAAENLKKNIADKIEKYFQIRADENLNKGN